MRSSVLAALSAFAVVGNTFPFTRLWPLGKRQVESQMTDVDILRYALTLEHLEDNFYREGLANFTQAEFATAGFDSTFYENVQTISAHETAHVQFLTAALNAAGYTPVQECTYAFGITSVAQFVATASVLEGVGTSAYLGAARQIANKDYLTAAGSILTVESRHSSYLRHSLNQSPFPQTQDDPLTPDEVHTMAHGFITSCPTGNPSFPIKAFPGLEVTTAAPIVSGQMISVQTAGYVLAPADSTAQLHAAFITAAGPIWATLTAKSGGIDFDVTVPQGVNGQSYLLFSNCNDMVTDDTVVAGPTHLEITNPTSGSNATYSRTK